MRKTLFATLFLLATIPAVPGIGAAEVRTISWDPVTMYTNDTPIDPTISVAYDIFWTEDPALAPASLHPIAFNVPGTTTTFDPDLLGMPRGRTVYVTLETVLGTGEVSDLSSPSGWMVPLLVSSTSSPPDRTVVGTAVRFTAQATGVSGPYEYKFWLRNLAGAWSVVRNFAPGNTWTWDTTGLPTGTYCVQVWSRNVGSTAGYEGFSPVANYFLSTIPPATSVAFTPPPSPSSPQVPGASVVWSVSASGGSGNYQYQFWLNANGTWAIAKPYGTTNDNTWTWNTTGLSPGTYSVQVWARNTGSTATYESYTSVASYVLAPPAAAVSFTPPPSPSSPKVAGTSVVWSAAASGGSGSYEYKFWLKNPAGVWSVVRDYASANTWNWDTSGSPTGTYSVQAWARNAGSTATFETYTSVAGYVLAPPAAAVSFTPPPSPASPRSSGGSVVWSAAASGGSGSYEYKFWLRNPAGAWSVVRDYASANIWTWNTTGLPVGTYNVQAWSRNAGSTATYEAYTSVASYVLTDPPPPAAEVAFTPPPSPSSPRVAGTSVVWSAAASGGSGSYEYKFWLRNPAGVWSVVRDYASANTWTWNTTDVPAGSYSVQVFARSVGSIAAYEAYTPVERYILSPKPATAVTITPPPSPASPRSSGGSVLWSAAASGGSGSYEYKFWLKNPAGVWSVVRDYASANTWTWNTAGLATGTYNVQVWARSAGSSATYETYTSVASYVLTDPLPPATGVTLSASPQPPKPTGTSVTFTAQGSGGTGSYEYQFWSIEGPVGTVVQGFSSLNTWTWDTAGLAAGPYLFHVLVRSAGSGSAGDAGMTYYFPLQ